MQSGLAKTEKWLLEYELTSRREPESLMGWVSSGDTLNQVRLKFDTMEGAVDFARKNGWGYTIMAPRERKVVPRNYADNFRYAPPQAQEK